MSGKVETKNDTQRSHLSSFTMKLKDKFHPPKIKRVTDKIKRTPDKIKRTPSKRASKPPANLEIKNIDAPTNKTVCVLEEQEKEVVSALRYFKTIVDKMLLDARVLEMLPASASKVLEAVVPLVQLEPRIQHSKTVSSCLTRLHQSLANLIRWSDQVMLQAVALDDKETVATVTTVIRGVLDDVKELVRLTVERQDGPSPTSPVAPTPDTHLPDGDCTGSPEPVPSALPGPTHPDPALTQSETARTAINQSEPEEQQEEEGSAPPKPALPSRQTPENSAPVLPPKRRQITAKVAIVAPMRRDISLPEKGQEFEDQCVKRRLSGGSVCGGEGSDLSPSSSLSNLSLSSTRPASFCMEAQDQKHSTAASLDLYDSDYDFLHEDLSSSETLPPFPLLPPFPSLPLPPLSSLPPLSPLQESPSSPPLSVSPVPPALPQKRRQSAAIQATPPGRLTLQRRPSHYDNVAPDEQPPSTPPFPVALSDSTSDSPPPLPEKKKHIFQYLQFMEDYSEPQAWTFYQRPANHSRYQQRTRELQEVYGLTHTQQLGLPAPALPPKQRQRASLSGSSHSHAASLIPPIPSSFPSTSISPSASLCPSPPPSLLTSPSLRPEEDAIFCPSVSNSSPCDTTDSGPVEDDMEKEDPTQDGSQGAAECVEAGVEEGEEELCLIDQQEVMGRMTLKSEEEEGPDVRAASADILLVHATVNNTPDQELYCDAFLATYRCFISPQEIIRKLHYRYSRLCEGGEPQHLRASKNTFLLLVRVVDELCSVELVEEFQGQLMELVFSLLIGGELCLARLLRGNILSKLEQRRQLMTCPLSLRPLAARGVAARPGTLLDFRSQDVADQLTLMDAELFYKIELPEVLLWSKEQNEEKSPNLTQFTQHFNSMSYWVRSLIILQEKAQDREKLLLKFLKVMKHLRKLNNFNSYLAILSALDSAPLRRLDWQRQTAEGLEEYSALIDSSSSFRTYRAALAEVEPPCIPYLGLILQDLTFVHLGNPDLLLTSDPEGSHVNFSKRWQQFNILDTMRSFQQVPYELKPSEEIVSFFNDFSDHLSEEALWELSLRIRPRNTPRSNQRHGNS